MVNMSTYNQVIRTTAKGVLLTTLVSAVPLTAIFAQHDPKPVFKGEEGKTLATTKQWRADKLKAPEGAPNVVWILLDDIGFGASSAFGGLIETPVLDSLADNGLRYTNFHTTAICAPTRAALLTGRNAHSVGMGLFTETAIGTQGYNGRIPFETGTIAEIFKENGYNTFALGKWHVTPVDESTPAGPFNRWPTGRGFERWYGFLGGETDQWHPQLWDGIQQLDIEPNKKHLNQLLADKAIEYIANQQSAAPDKPFFLYFAPGATHAPHQVAKEWIAKYKGKFDKGWDSYREEVFKRQQQLGIVPKGASLAPRNANIKAWKDLSPEQQKLYAHFFEVYAAFFSYTDYEIGRVVNYIRELGQLDNTLIVVMIGDNGGSKEGTDVGTTTGLNVLYQGPQDLKTLIAQQDSIGTEHSAPNYPLGWALATNTPFRYWKSDANAEGGTHNPLILFYPKLKQKGIRTQYSHVTDILPTTVELTGIKIPDVINGYKQDTIQGISLAYSVNDANAPARHTQQYYEIMGSRSIYKDGWKAGAFHPDGGDFEKDKWELYNLQEDWTETNDLAVQNPDKLQELKALFDSEATKYHIYPLKDRVSSRLGFTGGNRTKQVYVLYSGLTQYWSPSAPRLVGGNFKITATAEVTGNTEGVVLANGGRFGGISLFIRDKKWQLAYNDGYKNNKLVSDKEIPAGVNELSLVFESEAKPIPATGELQLFINNNKVASLKVGLRNGLLYYNYDEGLDIGRDGNTPVDESYKVPYKFSGKLKKVVIETF